MKNNNEITTANNDKITPKKNNGVFLSVIKIIALFALIAVSYFVSYLMYGFNETNKKLFILLVFAIGGFILFYLVYGIAYLFSNSRVKRNLKKVTDNEIHCDDKVATYFETTENSFTYNKKLTLKENGSIALNKAFSIIVEIAKLNSHSGKYAFVNFTVYDALEVFGNALDGIHDKLFGILSALKFEDKPIWFIEKNLAKILYEEEVVSEVSVTSDKKQNKVGEFFSGVKNKVTGIASNLAITLFSKKLESTINDCYVFIAGECFRVFSKNGKYNEKAVNKNEWVFNRF